MELQVIYEDEDVLVVDKPAGIIVFPAAPEGEPSQGREEAIAEKTLIDFLLEKFPYLKQVGQFPRHGIVHRLDKETSGILLVAKHNKSLKFLQKKFKERGVLKKYAALLIGDLKPNQGKIETLIGRSPRDRKKQRVFSFTDPQAQKKGMRNAITEYKVLEKFSINNREPYTLVEAIPRTGRKHQLRCHFSYLGHPIVGDKVYGFKKQPAPEKLNRHFLHASYLRIELPGGKSKEFKSYLPKDLGEVLEQLKLKSKK